MKKSALQPRLWSEGSTFVLQKLILDPDLHGSRLLWHSQSQLVPSVFLISNSFDANQIGRPWRLLLRQELAAEHDKSAEPSSVDKNNRCLESLIQNPPCKQLCPLLKLHKKMFRRNDEQTHIKSWDLLVSKPAPCNAASVSSGESLQLYTCDLSSRCPL